MKFLFLFALMIWPFIAFAYGQQNQTDEIVIVESDALQQKIAEKTTDDLIHVKISNDFWPDTLLDIILILSGLASVAFVIVLWRQNKQTETSMKLSYGPVIHGRYHSRSGFPRLLIDNVGNGPALDLNLEIKTPDGKTVLDTVNRLALTPSDPTHGTKVDLSKYPEVLLVGTYKDANRVTQPIHHIIQFSGLSKKEEKEEK